MVKVLLAHQVPIDARDQGGQTALMFAAGTGREDVVRLLLASGARADLRNGKGETAAAIAKKNHQGDVEILLRDGTTPANGTLTAPAAGIRR